MSRPYRPANGRDPLPQPYNADFIPADPFGPRPTRTMSLPAALPENRSTKVTSRFNSETGELVIQLNDAEPLKEKENINSAISSAKRQGILRLVTVIVASEVFGQLESFLFFRKNGFIRNEGREAGAGGFITLEKRMGEKNESKD